MAPGANRQSIDPIEKRRSRNRISQRHFRERRERYVKELEDRLKFHSMNERERDSKLVRDHDALFSVLQKTRSHLDRLKTGIEELCTVIDEYSVHSVDKSGDAGPSDVQRHVSSDYERMLTSDMCAQNATLIPTEPNRSPDAHEAPEGQECTVFHKDLPNLDVIGCEIGTSLNQITNAVETYLAGSCMDQLHLESSINPLSAREYPLPPLEIFGNSFLFSLNTNDSWFLQRLYGLLDGAFAGGRNTSISLSEHIDRAIGLVRDYLKIVGGFNSYTKTSQAWMIAMIVFTKYISPLPATMWFSSYCYSIIEKVVYWQVHQSAHCSDLSAPGYEPSALQLSTKHSSLIDWIVVAPLRDRLIANYNRSDKLDEVFVDLMKHTVVEVADLSRILVAAPEGPGFLGVWNLFSAMDVCSQENMQTICRGDTIELQDDAFAGLMQMHKMPPPDETWVCQVTCPEDGYWQAVPFGELLGSPELVKQLYHALRVYDAHRHWKIDPAFFEIYPELKYEGFIGSCARGTSYRLTSSWG